jgi:hypothetical protein
MPNLLAAMNLRTRAQFEGFLEKEKVSKLLISLVSAEGLEPSTP